jgi:hypothetical protein
MSFKRLVDAKREKGVPGLRMLKGRGVKRGGSQPVPEIPEFSCEDRASGQAAEVALKPKRGRVRGLSTSPKRFSSQRP